MPRIDLRSTEQLLELDSALVNLWYKTSRPALTVFRTNAVTQTNHNLHYDDVIMTMLASQITSLTVVYSIVYSGVNQRKHQSSASLAFVRAIHRGPVNFPHKWPVTRKMFPFDDVIMWWLYVIAKETNRTNYMSVHKSMFAPLQMFCHWLTK